MTRLTMRTHHPQLLRRVCEKTHTPAAVYSILTRLSPVPVRMQPTLKNTMRKLTTITFFTTPFTKLWACGTGITVLPGITPACFFAGVSVRTVRPVM
ncbi:hypothetical protein HanRHA438_Chr06g0258481 [Helianthus annuus]|nr:hypothetical protein HanRHA438_Chr06g0258481 [Helianthus annuus]